MTGHTHKCIITLMLIFIKYSTVFSPVLKGSSDCIDSFYQLHWADSVPDSLQSPGSSDPVCSWMWQAGSGGSGSYAGSDKLCCSRDAGSSGCSLCGGKCSWWMKGSPVEGLSVGAHCCGNCPAETPGGPGQRPLEDVWCGYWRCWGWTLEAHGTTWEILLLYCIITNKKYVVGVF